MDCPASHRLRRGRFSEPGRAYLLTTTTKDRFPYFADFQAARSLPLHFNQAEQEGSLQSLAWVIMPDHVHWLIELGEDTLATVMRRFKSRSRCSLFKLGMLNGPLWQPGYHDRALRREEDLREFARYVLANPLRSGLAKRLGEYPHWDAVWV
ncbi:REP-associated tyrosine transposase [Pseudomonas sichuanensis]|uniref:REP-associated tyrosine transposase n=1 Tax=Pseudomonas sichuanensis TaxID=2213015 RepID=UPI000DA68318|nr:transposase [Pseudomonas sichuanensis]